MKNNFFKKMPIILGCLLMLTACNNSNEIQDSGSSDTTVNSTGGSSEGSDIRMENSGNSADNSNPDSSSANETGTGSGQGDSQGNSSSSTTSSSNSSITGSSSGSTTVSNSSSSTTENSVPESKPSTTETPDNSSDVITGTRAIIAIDGVEYGMIITDTTIGRAFAEKLRDEGGYTVTGYRAADDICCSEEESLETDSSENMPWVCGGIAWTGTWFTVWVSEEAAGRDMPVIAQIDEEHLEELQKVSGSMEIEVRLAAE